MTKNSNDLKTRLAEASARYLLGNLEKTVPNAEGGITALVRPTLSQGTHFLVEISRWGKLLGLTRVKGSELTHYESTSIRFTLLSELLKVERTRAAVAYERQLREDILKNLGTAGETATSAGKTAYSFGRSAFDRVSKEAKPTLEKVYGELKPRAERAYGEAKPALIDAYRGTGPALQRAYEGAKGWLLEEEPQTHSVLVTLFADGYVVVQSGESPEEGQIEGETKPGEIYELLSGNGFEDDLVSLDLEWQGIDGFSLSTNFGHFHTGEIEDDTKVVVLVSEDGFGASVIELEEPGVQL